MKLIKPFNEYVLQENEIGLFLGGACGESNWRESFYKYCQAQDTKDLVIYDPFNPHISNVVEQIQWEFKYLNNSKNIISLYFDNKTEQPITMYELGRLSCMSTTQTIQVSMGNTKTWKIPITTAYDYVITINPTAPKMNEIVEQLNCAGMDYRLGDVSLHCQEILKLVKYKREGE